MRQRRYGIGPANPELKRFAGTFREIVFVFKTKIQEMNSLNRPALIVAALAGVPAALFFDLTDITGYRREQLAEVFDTSLKTFQRYDREKRTLTPQDGERLLKMKALFEHGTDVFDSVESFRRWLDKPAYGLDNQVPFLLLHTSGGMDLIQDELIRIEYGDLA